MGERNEEICELRRQGMTYKDIGERYGITVSRVRQIVNKKLTRERRALECEIYTLGLSYRVARCLALHGIYTADDLYNADIENIKNFRGLGTMAIGEIENWRRKYDKKWNKKTKG